MTSLRWRLGMALSVLVVLAVISSGWLVLLVARASIIEAQGAQARTLALQVGDALVGATPPGALLQDPRSRAAIARTAAAFQQVGGVREITVVDREGVGILGADPQDELLWAARLQRPVVRRQAGAIFAYAGLRQGGQIVGTLRLRLDADDELSSALGRARSLLWALALVDVGIVMLVGAALVRRVVRPIEALSRQAGRVARGELDAPALPVPGGAAELADLTRTFNDMTASLREQRTSLVAQERLVTVGQLAAGVAHEVGNPLTAILGYVDLLLADPAVPGDPSDEMRRDALTRVRKETARISEIVRDLLDYSRPISSQDSAVAVSLGECVRDAVQLMKPQARFRGIEVDVSLPSDLPVVRASSGRVTQILINLLLNAADAMNGTGRIAIVATHGGGAVTLKVSDGGPGIPDEHRARIFDPFFTTKEPGKGTGLGLAVSRSIAEAFGGELKLSSEGPGATFLLRLPVWLRPGENTGTFRKP